MTPAVNSAAFSESQFAGFRRSKNAHSSPVDSLTQATLGAAVGELVLGRRLGNRAMLWGAVFGTLPDLDALFSPLFDQAGYLWWHRGPSHSLLVMVLAALLLARPLSRLWTRERIGAGLAAWFVLLEWSTHVLIDCFTNYGTLVFWPFDATRVAFGNLFIIDPLFTLPMLVGLLWIAFLRKPSQLAKRRRINAIGLGLAFLYAGLGFGAKAVASHRFEEDLARRGVSPLRRIEAPTPFNILLWRSVVDRGDSFWVGYRSLLDPASDPIRWTIYPKGREAADPLAESRELELIEHFTDGWWICRPHAKGLWIGDLRFGEMREWGNRKGMVDHRLVFSWDLLSAEPRNRLHPLRLNRGQGVSSMVKALASRAFAKRQHWEAHPRLEGVTGSLPESLAVEP